MKKERFNFKRVVAFLVSPIIASCAILGSSVRSPDSDVPFTYQIGWWPYQEFLEVTALRTKIVDSRLNLFNAKTLVSINIQGKIRNDNNWKPYIKAVHISEKVVHSGNFANSEAEIQVTPIIKTKEDKTYKGEVIEFNINQELIVNSMGWGKNTYIITSQDKKQVIEVQQMK